MPQIDYIRGVPQNEFIDRGKMVSAADYIPLDGLTKGTASLAMDANVLKAKSEFYDGGQFKSAYLFLYDHLRGITHKQAYNDGERYAKSLISKASRNRKAASLAYVPEGVNGDIIPNFCLIQAVKDVYAIYKNTGLRPLPTSENIALWQGYVNYLRIEGLGSKIDKLVLRCSDVNEAVKIYNERLEDSSHHIIYHNFPTSFVDNYGTPTMAAKALEHRSAIEALKNVIGTDNELMSKWVNTGIVRKGLKNGQDILPINAAISAAASTGNSSKDKDISLENYMRWMKLYQSKYPAQFANNGIGERINEPLTWAIVITILTILSKVATDARLFRESTERIKANAFASVSKFGNDELNGKSGELDIFKNPTDPPETDTTSSGGILIPVILGAAAFSFLK